jgi:hypothetical protein
MKLHILIAALALSACATFQTPQQIVFNAEGIEIIGIRGATVYKQLPLCGGMNVKPPLCSTAAHVATVDVAITAADKSIEAAKRTVRDPAFGTTAARSSAVAASNAATALVDIVNALQK